MPPRLRNFYVVALWTPLVLPAIVGSVFAVRSGGIYEGAGSDVAFILVGSLLTAGVPYGLVALWATRWLTVPGREERDVRRLMWRAPLVVSAVCVPAWTITLAFHDGLLAGFGEAIVFFLPYLLVLGYLYVAAAAGAHALLRWLGVFPAHRMQPAR